ncbi:MAG: ABC transporter substrate-binding protein, partial [Pseudobdellovibrionaceae bacterium]
MKLKIFSVLFCLQMGLLPRASYAAPILRASSAAPLRLNLNWKAEPQFGGFYEAARTDKFKQNQLDVQILEGGSGTPTVQMLQNGQTDYAIVSAEEILLANERDPKKTVTAVFAVFQKNPQIIMTRQGNNLNSIQDIFKSDGVLAVQQGLSYFRFLENKLGKPKVKIVPYA